MISESDKSSDLAAFIGAEAFTSLRHESGTKYLTTLLDDLDRQSAIKMSIPDFSETVNHKNYLSLRGELAKSTALAAVAGDGRLAKYVNQWVKLQQGYAQQVIDEISSGISSQKDDLKLYEEELVEGEGIRERHKKLGEKYLELNNEEKRELNKLEVKIAELDGILEDSKKARQVVAGVSKVEQTLTSLIESGNHSIHYLIPSVDEAKEELGTNSYNGPIFDPFLVSNKVSVKDMFMRETEAIPTQTEKRQKDLNAGDLPPILSELVQIYEHITGQRPGTSINPSKVRKELSLEEVGSKGMRIYLNNDTTLFGVNRDASDSKTFTRQESGNVVDRKRFLEHMLGGRLQSPDIKKVNNFYFQQALELLREKPIAYIGFTKETVHTIAEKHGLPVSKIYISRNLKKLGDVKSVESEGKKENFVFIDVIPTERQEQYVKEAVEYFGINRFTSKELVKQVSKLHSDYRVHKKVVHAVLQSNLADFGLRISSHNPITYKRKDKSPHDVEEIKKPEMPTDLM
ncbi:hypothetical protein ACFL0E_00845 [Nanoarchaeota archaeon]